MRRRARAAYSFLFFFDTDLIADLAARIALPLNILVMPTAAPVAALAKAGVARISCGAWPIEAFAQAFGAAAAAFADTKDYASVPGLLKQSHLKRQWGLLPSPLEKDGRFGDHASPG